MFYGPISIYVGPFQNLICTLWALNFANIKDTASRFRFMRKQDDIVATLACCYQTT